MHCSCCICCNVTRFFQFHVSQSLIIIYHYTVYLKLFFNLVMIFKMNSDTCPQLNYYYSVITVTVLCRRTWQSCSNRYLILFRYVKSQHIKSHKLIYTVPISSNPNSTITRADYRHCMNQYKAMKSNSTLHYTDLTFVLKRYPY